MQPEYLPHIFKRMAYTLQLLAADWETQRQWYSDFPKGFLITDDMALVPR
jgi:hypothetical protein